MSLPFPVGGTSLRSSAPSRFRSRPASADRVAAGLAVDSSLSMPPAIPRLPIPFERRFRATTPHSEKPIPNRTRQHFENPPPSLLAIANSRRGRKAFGSKSVTMASQLAARATKPRSGAKFKRPPPRRPVRCPCMESLRQPRDSPLRSAHFGTRGAQAARRDQSRKSEARGIYGIEPGNAAGAGIAETLDRGDRAPSGFAIRRIRNSARTRSGRIASAVANWAKA